ncbi:Signal transduction histidine kinase [Bacillus sp. cl95]|nr:Signal transduction histidine kinase [Bacillus sp. UNCCL13]SFQ86652.1 Signal transduction histidine kinase [Bacillus sp. cl95]
MFVLLSTVCYLRLPDNHYLLKGFVILAAIIFAFNHFVIFTSKNQKTVNIVILTDAFLSFTYGFLFPGSTLYLILLGIVSVTLFLHNDNKKFFKACAIIFLIMWISVMYYWKKETGYLDFSDNLISTMFVFYGAVVGDLIRKLLSARETMNEQYTQLNDSHDALSDAHQQLKVYSKQVEELTSIHERNRIAREIHDTVGHKMTALLVQLELGRELIKLNPDKAGETLSVCDELARGALDEIRFSVRTIHPQESEHLSFIPLIRKLLGDFYKTTSLETVFELSGDPVMIPVSLQPTLIRLIQEAMTNAKRHGDARSFWLSIDCSSDEIIVTTKDNGKGVPSIHPGFGLINMKERVEEHGGSVLCQSKEGEGFHMKMNFPLLQKKWVAGGSK